MKQHYLPGILISDPVEGVSAKGTRCVKFTLRDEDGEDSQKDADLVNCWCFSAELWPAILGCRKGDALSLLGRRRQTSRTANDRAQGPGGEDLIVQRVLKVCKLPTPPGHTMDLPEGV